MKTIRFILISCGLAACFSCASLCRGGADAGEVLFAPEPAGRYRVHIRSGRMNLSGILAVKRFGEEWRGSLVNEFGLKAFDFAVKKRRCRLLNTFALLNKWYIRKAIEGDLSFLFRATQEGKGPKGKRLSLLPDGTFRITNERQGIEYTFQPMTE